MNEYIKDMLNKGLVSFGGSWIERAVLQKEPRLTLDLAHSAKVYLDRVDLVIITALRMN